MEITEEIRGVSKSHKKYSSANNYKFISNMKRQTINNIGFYFKLNIRNIKYWKSLRPTKINVYPILAFKKDMYPFIKVWNKYDKKNTITIYVYFKPPTQEELEKIEETGGLSKYKRMDKECLASRAGLFIGNNDILKVNNFSIFSHHRGFDYRISKVKSIYDDKFVEGLPFYKHYLFNFLRPLAKSKIFDFEFLGHNAPDNIKHYLIKMFNCMVENIRDDMLITNNS